jgi:hypothetical protein
MSLNVNHLADCGGWRRRKKGELKNAPRTHDIIENKHSEDERFPHTHDVD